MAEIESILAAIPTKKWQTVQNAFIWNELETELKCEEATQK